MRPIDFKKLWDIVSKQFPLGVHSIHGPRHWRQVEKNGLMLSKITGADENIIRLFSIFHDSRRKNEYSDREHGPRGAELATLMRGTYFDISDKSFITLIESCFFHNGGKSTSDITVATCWDADRLDLPRVGVIVDPNLLMTDYGRKKAKLLRKFS